VKGKRVKFSLSTLRWRIGGSRGINLHILNLVVRCRGTSIFRPAPFIPRQESRWSLSRRLEKNTLPLPQFRPQMIKAVDNRCCVFQSTLWKCSYCVSGVYLFGSPLGTAKVWMRKLSVLSGWSASGHDIWRRHDGAICLLSFATRVDFRIDEKCRRLLILSAELYTFTNNTFQQKTPGKIFFSGILPTLGSYRLVLKMKCSCIISRVAWFMDFPFAIHINMEI